MLDDDGSLVAKGTWKTITGPHVLVAMKDGKVLDWNRDDGTWRLWRYDPAASDILQGNPYHNPLTTITDPWRTGWAGAPPAPLAFGQWRSITGARRLIPMRDGRVLDWVEGDGTWRLWNYDPKSTGDIFPGNPVQQGKWASIGIGHRLIPMSDGRVLDFSQLDGSWRLWNYDPSQRDILPGNPAASGIWPKRDPDDTNVLSTEIVRMPGNDVMEVWLGSTEGNPAGFWPSSWRLWSYDAATPGSNFVPPEKLHGAWKSIVTGHELITMPDGNVLVWQTSDGSWRLWKYEPFLIGPEYHVYLGGT